MEDFAEAYAEGISAGDRDHVMQELVAKVRCRKLSAPGVPRSFREFMVTLHTLCANDDEKVIRIPSMTTAGSLN